VNAPDQTAAAGSSDALSSPDQTATTGSSAALSSPDQTATTGSSDAPSSLDVATLRAQFPVLRRIAYLNAGTDGPLPAAATQAAARELRREAEDGRSHHHFERRGELNSSLRAAYASILGCTAQDIALTTCTSEGLALVIEGLRLGPGDEILTSDEEHPGLLGSLISAREVHGVAIRAVPWSEVAAAVGPRTRLVACSHVSWMTGRMAPAELAQTRVPVLLDGAQGVGAIPTDVHALGCAAYAGAGQKWLCGPDGSGMLYTTPELRERLAVTRRGYANLADPGAGLEAELHEDARRLDTLSLNAETVACALAAFGVLERAGWAQLHERAQLLAAELAQRLADHGREVVGRSAPAPGGSGPQADASPPATADGQTTLVSFSSPDPLAEREHLAAQGIILRDIPGRPWLRASVGAWNNEEDFVRLLEALFTGS
jgi:selenocysteine lyase/cysteine desulfurase